eukprot:gene5002-10009_t
MLQKLIRDLQLSNLKQLQKCKLRLPEASYLVGAPDPCGVLAPGEVFLYPHSKAGPVLVTRHPMYHPGDVRKLICVENEVLEEFFNGTKGSIIIFSTQGTRSAADEMSGGDFDGDLYLRRRNAMADEEGWDMFENLLLTAQRNLLGRYSHSWLATADQFGPDCADALACHEQIMIALDAAKTGLRVKVDSRLLNVVAPHYMITEKSCDVQMFNSVSVVGELFDICEKAMWKISKDKMISTATETSTATCNDPQNNEEKASNGSLEKDEQSLDHLKIDADFCTVSSHFDLAVENVEALLNLWLQHLREYKYSMAGILRETMSTAEKRNLTDKLKRKYINIFHTDAKDVRDRVGSTYYDARRLIAGIIYRATYQSAVRDKWGGYPISFCWEICAQELACNKYERMAFKQGVWPRSPYLPSEKDFILGVGKMLATMRAS